MWSDFPLKLINSRVNKKDEVKNLTISRFKLKIEGKSLFLITLYVMSAIFGIFLLSILDTSDIPFEQNNLKLINEKVQSTDSLAYTPHSPIFIDGVPALIAGGWPGSGTNEDPYVISGLNITGPPTVSLIEIKNIPVSIKINNCILIGGRNGIEFSEVGSKEATISIISHNIITKSVEHGILLSCNTTLIKSNTITFNGRSGIYFSDYGVNINISCNNILSNTEYGVEIPQSHMDFNEISWNCFIGNNPGGSSQALDNGPDNKFKYNYWDEWVSQSDDTDGDGILNTAYPIQGGNTDNFPRIRCCMYIITAASPGFEYFFSIGGLFFCIFQIWRRKSKI